MSKRKDRSSPPSDAQSFATQARGKCCALIVERLAEGERYDKATQRCRRPPCCAGEGVDP